MVVVRKRLLIGLLPAVLIGAQASADVVTLGTAKDNTLYEDVEGDVSNGAGSYFFTGRTAAFGGFSFRRGLIAFDIVGNIPAGSTINSVELTLHMSKTRLSTARTTELHRALADWGEGTSNAGGNEGMGTAATTGDATWLHTFFATDFWATPGGDFSVTVSASQSVGSITFYTWGSTPEMVADVQMWLDNPSSNFGWVVTGDEVLTTTAKRFDSRENLTAANRPMLTIDFTPPAIIGACCDDLTGNCDDDVDLSECTGGGGRFGGEDSTCETIDPPCLPSGACCDDAMGICAEGITQDLCEILEGFRYGGDASTCATIDPPCEPPPPMGACCNEVTGDCGNDVEQDVCESGGGRFGGDGSDCETLDPPCEGSGACCDDLTGFCGEGVFQSECEGAGLRYGGNASTCKTIDPPCLPPPIGACCVELQGVCIDNLLDTECDAEGGRFGGDGSDCSTIDPPCQPVISIGLEVVAGSAVRASQDEGLLLTAPLSVTHAGDGSGRLFIVDQPGFIRIVKEGELLAEPFLDLTSKIVALDPGFDERGLLGLAFHPDYAANGRFFVRYSAPGGGGDHRAVVAEYHVLGDPATSDVGDLDSEIIVFTVDEPEFNHNGGDIAFGPDGLLYFALGDGGGANDGLDDPGLPHGPLGNGQNIETTLGSLLRIDVGAGAVLPDDFPADPDRNYAIPPGNPFADGVQGAPEIFAYGFRNPYRFSFDDGPGGDGSLYLGDVGQELFEEINVLPPPLFSSSPSSPPTTGRRVISSADPSPSAETRR